MKDNMKDLLLQRPYYKNQHRSLVDSTTTNSNHESITSHDVDAFVADVKRKLEKRQMQVIDTISAGSSNNRGSQTAQASSKPPKPPKPILKCSGRDAACPASASTKEARSQKYPSKARALMDDTSTTDYTCTNDVTTTISADTASRTSYQDRNDTSIPVGGGQRQPYQILSNLSMTLSNMSQSNLSSNGADLPLPPSNIPKYKQLFGRLNELEILRERLSEGGTLTCITGVGGIGKSHFASQACHNWLKEDPGSRFVLWLDASTEWNLRASYLEALYQVLMEKSSTLSSSRNRGEIIVVAELLHRQLSKQREQLTSATNQNIKEEHVNNRAQQILSEILSDNSYEEETFNDQKSMDTKKLARLLWDSLLQGISPDYEWIVVFQNLPRGMGEEEGPRGLQDYLFPTGDVFEEEWSQGRILFTSRYQCHAGQTHLGHVQELFLDRLEEAAAVDMLVSQFVLTANDDVDVKKRFQILQDGQAIARKLVGPAYLDGSPIMLATAIGAIASTGITIREYYDTLKNDVAYALETSGYLHGKVECSVKRETSMSVCLEQAIDNANAQDLCDILSVAVFLNHDSMSLQLLGGDRERVQTLCEMNLLTEIGKDTYCMHRIHQRAAADAIVASQGDSRQDTEQEEALCKPDLAVSALHSTITKYLPTDATTWRKARSCIPHVQALRAEHDIFERNQQLSDDFNRIEYAEIISHAASVMQWAMKDKPAAFQMYHEALRLQRSLFHLSPGVVSTRTGKGSNLKSKLAIALASTLTSLGALSETNEDAQRFFTEALQVYSDTFGEDSKSSEMMSLYAALADVELKLDNMQKTYDLCKRALEVYFRLYGHNQNIYEDDQRLFLAETLLKVGTVAHQGLERHAEAELYLEGTVTLLKAMPEDSPHKSQDRLIQALESLGSVCQAQNRINDATEYYKRALKMKGELNSEATLTDLSSSCNNADKRKSRLGNSCNSSDKAIHQSHSLKGHPAVTPRRLAKSLDLVSTGDEDDASRTTQESRDGKLAKTLHRLGVMAWNLGNLKQAQEYFENSLMMHYRCYGDNAMNIDVAITLFALGGILSENDDADQKVVSAHYKRALECYYFVYGKDAQNQSIAELLHSLGKSLNMLQEHKTARIYLMKSLDMKYNLTTNHDKVMPDLVSTHLELGKIARSLNNSDEARYFFKAGLNGLLLIHGKEAKTEEIAATLDQLGGLSYCAGDLEEAEEYYKQSLEMKYHIHGKDAAHDDLASTLNNLGSLNAREKHFEEAFKYYMEALNQYYSLHERGITRSKSGTDIRIDQARTLHNLGLLSYNLKRYDDAKKYYSESVKIKTDVSMETGDLPDIALTLKKLSLVETKQGNNDAANYYEKQAERCSSEYMEAQTKLQNKVLANIEIGDETCSQEVSSLPENTGYTDGYEDDSNSDHAEEDAATFMKSIESWERQGVAKSSKSCWYPLKKIRCRKQSIDPYY